MGKTGILIITICSNNKVQGGSPFIKGKPSIINSLPELAQTVIRKRQTILHLLKEGNVVRDNIEISNMQLNSRLRLGPDIGGNEASLYMPAHQRYIGRFFSEACKNNPSIFTETDHHVLILSALYGILLPEEQIQAYSCHVDDNPLIKEIWQESGFLTSLILAYINNKLIKMVLDLTGQESYRELVDWERITRKAEVLHFFSEQYAGPSSLPALGELARTELLMGSEEDLLAMKAKSSIYLNDHGRIISSVSPKPADDLPRESFVPVQKRLKTEPSRNDAPPITEVTPAILDHARDISITSGEHNTFFNKKIARINDLPVDVQEMVHSISRCPDVLEIFLGKFLSNGPNRHNYVLKISVPQPDSGHIFATLEGPAAIGRRQNIDVRVTRGREAASYMVIVNLLNGGKDIQDEDSGRDEKTSETKETSMYSVKDFENALRDLFDKAQNEGQPYLEVISGDLHRKLGGYPGPKHNMPSCCLAMTNIMVPGDEVLDSPPKGKGATLRIRYCLPR